MSEKLKPCPFCGGEATIKLAPDSWVECTVCGGSSRMTTSAYVKDWNTRTSLPVVEDREKELERCKHEWVSLGGDHLHEPMWCTRCGCAKEKFWDAEGKVCHVRYHRLKPTAEKGGES